MVQIGFVYQYLFWVYFIMNKIQFFLTHKIDTEDNMQLTN